MADLAAQAGLVLANSKLIEDLRASRQRLVAAQDEERRRLERNLHDGAQQQLVALAIRLKLARTTASKDLVEADRMLEQLEGDVTDALENLRELARGVYPPLLADQGLTAAIDAQSRRSAVPVRVEADGIDRYPQEIETAVYFCTLEALQNAAKYADAGQVTVRLVQDDGELVLSVRDDGRGFDPAVTPLGAGLQNMSDRLAALGGTLIVRSRAGGGTTIEGRIPVRAPPRRIGAGDGYDAGLGRAYPSLHLDLSFSGGLRPDGNGVQPSSTTTDRTSADRRATGSRDSGRGGSISTTSGCLPAPDFAVDRALGDRGRLSSVSVKVGRASPTVNAIVPCSVIVSPSSSRCNSPRLRARAPSNTLRKASRIGMSCSLNVSTSIARGTSFLLSVLKVGYRFIRIPIDE